MYRKKQYIPLFYVMVIIIVILARGGAAYFYPEIAGDTPVYKTVALNILYNNCISLSNPNTRECVPHWGGNQPPGYPFYIAMIYYIFNTSNSIIAFIQVIVFILVLLRLMYSIYQLTNKHTVAIMAGIIMGLSPLHIFWTRMILSDSMALAATIWVFAEIILSITKRDIQIVKMSIAIAVSFFFRYDAVLILIPVIGLCLYLYEFRIAIKKCILILLIISIPIGAFLIRNHNAGLSLVRPYEFYEKDGTVGPLGFYDWVNTWVDRPGNEMSWIAPARMQEYDKLKVPKWAYKDNEELNKVKLLLDALNKYQYKPIPEYIDKEFELIAKDRINKYPLWHYVILPIKKAIGIWLWPFHSEAWPKAKIQVIKNHYNSDNSSNLLIKGLLKSLINDPVTVVSRVFLVSYKYLLFIILMMIFIMKKKIYNSNYSILHYAVIVYAISKTLLYTQYHVLQSRLLISVFAGMEIVSIIYLSTYFDQILKKFKSD